MLSVPESVVALVESVSKCDAEGCSVWSIRPFYVVKRAPAAQWDLYSVCSPSCVAAVSGL